TRRCPDQRCPSSHDPTATTPRGATTVPHAPAAPSRTAWSICSLARMSRAASVAGPPLTAKYATSRPSGHWPKAVELTATLWIGVAIRLDAVPSAARPVPVARAAAANPGGAKTAPIVARPATMTERRDNSTAAGAGTGRCDVTEPPGQGVRAGAINHFRPRPF